jgi:hypothetical protein
MFGNRRSRVRRTSTGKRIALTARDLSIFRALSRYRYLRSTYLHAFAGGASETRFKERLGDLFHEGYLNRPDQQWQFANARCLPAVYEIGNAAERVLRESGDIPSGSRTYLAKNAHRQFAHTLLICDVLASIELGAGTAGLRFIGWSEILARAPEATKVSAMPYRMPTRGGAVIPDGLFGLEYRVLEQSRYRFFALEVDRGTMPLERSEPGRTCYLSKLAGYEDIVARQLHKSHLGVSKLFVLTLTTGARRLSELVQRLDRLAECRPLFLFKAVPSSDRALSVPSPELLSEPWLRAGLPGLSIGESG